MSKIGTALLVAMLSVFAFVGLTASAEAHWRHGNCCGPIAPTTIVTVHHAIRHVTNYSDETVTHYVHIPHVYNHVTKIVPILYVNNIIRVHHKQVPVVYSVQEYHTYTLPTQVYSSTHRVDLWEGCCCRK